LGVLKLAPAATVAGLDAELPLRMRPCAAPLSLPAGPALLHAGSPLLRPYLVALTSRPTAPPLAPGAGRPGGRRSAVATSTRVLSPGDQGRGSYTGVRVRVTRPSWLVLGESYNTGWRATCDGRSLGDPRVVDGFANGWRVRPGCRRVEFRFAPQSVVDAGYWIGAIGCALLAAILLLRRPRRRPELVEPADLPVDDGLRPWSPRSAAAAGLAAGAVLGFAFALRAGLVIAPAVALILWRGWSPRVLLGAAASLLVVVVPLLYVLFPGDDRGGYDADYALEHLGAHWVTVAAVVLLVLAVWLGWRRQTTNVPPRSL
jgi:hypothetical protein